MIDIDQRLNLLEGKSSDFFIIRAKRFAGFVHKLTDYQGPSEGGDLFSIRVLPLLILQALLDHCDRLTGDKDTKKTTSHTHSLPPRVTL